MFFFDSPAETPEKSINIKAEADFKAGHQ